MEIAAIHQASDEMRGGYEFWGVHFSVADLQAATAWVTDGGGEILSEYDDPLGRTALGRDPDGAAFFLVEPLKSVGSSEEASRPARGVTKWKTILALAVIFVAVLTGLNWVWGVLFIMWTLPALRSGQIYLVEPLTRQDHPALFWLIIGTWLSLSIYLVLADLLPWAGF